MNRPSHLHAVPTAPDPLAEARAAGNRCVDDGLDALAVALKHFEDAERYRELLPVGVMQMLDGLQRTIPQVVLAITSIRERGR